MVSEEDEERDEERGQLLPAEPGGESHAIEIYL